MSSFYKTPLRSDELYHWKYKDKYKKGDHWVYIYDDGSTSEATNPSIQGRSVNYNGQTGEVTKTTKWKSTNPEHFFTTKHTVVTKTGEKSMPSVTGDSRARKFTEAHEYTEYGKLHMARMNLERKISTMRVEYEGKAKRGKSFVERLFGLSKEAPSVDTQHIQNPPKHDNTPKPATVTDTKRQIAKYNKMSPNEQAHFEANTLHKQANPNPKQKTTSLPKVKSNPKTEQHRKSGLSGGTSSSNRKTNTSSKPKQTNTKENEPKKRKNKGSAAKRAARWHIYKGTY